MCSFVPPWFAALYTSPINPQQTTTRCLMRRLLAVMASTLLISAYSSAPSMALATSESKKALSPHARQCIQSQVEAIKYGVRSADTVEGAPCQAHNPAMGYIVHFEREQVRVNNARPKTDAWNLTMKLAAYGYEGRLKPVQPAEIISKNNRLTYNRGDIQEWYVNTPAGIEQGFTVNRPPGQKGLAPLQFRIAVGGDLQPRISADNKNIDLYNASGKRMLTYRKLKVFDADGKVLPARMTAVAATAEKASAAILIAVNDASAAYPIIVDPVISTPKLTAADGMADDHFGYSVSVSGDTVVVGAVGNDENGSDSGAAYIFDRNQGGADNWGQTAKLTAPDGAAEDEFGISVGISGNTVIVGALYDDDRGTVSGSAYIFDRNQGGADNWGHLTKLTPDDGAAYDQFGHSVSISGDTVVVGAYTHDYLGLNTGAAYIFDRNQGGADNWGQTTKLTADDLTDWDQFGYSVAISGDTLVVGARYDDDNGYESGSAYIFDRNQGGADNWGQSAKLTASDGATIDVFGSSVAISGDTAVVGAPEDDDHGDASGSAYIFDRNQGWGQTAKLTSGGLAIQDVFGRSVAISGNTVVVGVFWDDGDHINSGSAHIFKRNQGGANNWGRTDMLTAADEAQGDALGWSVAMTDNIVVVGALWDDDNGDDSGSAYIMDGLSVVTVTPTSGLTTSEGGNSATFTVVLKSPVTADVTIGLSSSDDSEGTVSPGALTFTSSNWDQAQTVTVTGVDDVLADGDQAYTIITSTCVSGDAAYDGINPADVSVTNTDDDTDGDTDSDTDDDTDGDTDSDTDGDTDDETDGFTSGNSGVGSSMGCFITTLGK